MLKMVGSMDSLEFCPEVPNTEKNAIPLDCWHDINLSNIWIPSHLLPNRSKPSNMRVLQGIYHTLERKDVSKYVKSFSVYTFASIENEQGEIFISDSDEDIFGSDSAISEKIQVSDNTLLANHAYPQSSNSDDDIFECDSASSEKKQVSDNTLTVVENHMCPYSSTCLNDLKNGTETTILSKNPERGNRHLNLKKNLVANGIVSPCLNEICHEEKLKKISSNENLINMTKIQQNDSGACAKILPNSINTGSQKHFAVIKENLEVEADGSGDSLNKNTDSVSLKDILDDTPEVNMKDFVFNFKKKDDPFLLCSYEKKVKKNKKDKVKKKSLKYVTLDNFLGTKTEDTQDYCCDKYFQSILNTKQKGSNVPVEGNEEFPHLVFDGHMSTQFIHSNKAITKNYVKTSFNDLKSEEINKNIIEESYKTVTENIEPIANNHIKPEEIKECENIIDEEEINPCITDATFGKIVMENIPPDVSEEDILGLLYGSGEIKNFSLVSAGKYLTAYIEIYLNCDIDWIIECLNGSEPFGASTEKILCYKQ